MTEALVLHAILDATRRRIRARLLAVIHIVGVKLPLLAREQMLTHSTVIHLARCHFLFQDKAVLIAVGLYFITIRRTLLALRVFLHAHLTMGEKFSHLACRHWGRSATRSAARRKRMNTPLEPATVDIATKHLKRITKPQRTCSVFVCKIIVCSKLTC